MLQDAGLKGDKTILLATAGVGLIKLLFIFPPVFLLDRYGRKPMLMISTLGVAMAQALMSANFHWDLSIGVAITAQCLFMASFSLGLGPICWVVTSEVFALEIRGLAMGMGTFVNRMVSGAISLSFLSLNDHITPEGTFLLFTVVAIISFLYAWRVLPETRGKSLEEIEAFFRSKNKNQRKANRRRRQQARHGDGNGVGGDNDALPLIDDDRPRDSADGFSALAESRADTDTDADADADSRQPASPTDAIRAAASGHPSYGTSASSSPADVHVQVRSIPAADPWTAGSAAADARPGSSAAGSRVTSPGPTVFTSAVPPVGTAVQGQPLQDQASGANASASTSAENLHRPDPSDPWESRA